MTDRGVRSRGERPRGGRHWVFTAVTAPVPILLYLVIWRSGAAHEACVVAHPGADKPDLGGPCGPSAALGGVTALALITILAASVVVGLILGVLEGRRRNRFGHGRIVCVTVVGLTAPWALLFYAIGYGVGRLLPAPKPTPMELAYQQGWQTAVQLYIALAAGHRPPAVTAPGIVDVGFFGGDTICLDVPLLYSRFYDMNVTFHPGSTFAVGSPGMVSAAVIAGMIGNSAGRARAANLARPQWREHQHCRVIVTSTATWCNVNGRWLEFGHDAVIEYHVSGSACVLTFAGAEPLQLSGPSAWCHAVLFAYQRFGSEGWRRAGFLEPVRVAAHSLASAAQTTPAP